jgi:hypothetical protein
MYFYQISVQGGINFSITFFNRGINFSITFLNRGINFSITFRNFSDGVVFL